MAYNQAYLQKVALDGFAIIDERFGRGPSQGQYIPHHHHQKRVPNQYSYEEPDHDEPSTFRTYRPPSSTKQSCETWYFVPVPQAPKKQGVVVINDSQAAENYGGKLFKDHGRYTTRTVRTYRWGYN